MTQTRPSSPWRPARSGGHFDEFDPTVRYPFDGWDDEAWTDDEPPRPTVTVVVRDGLL